MFKDLNVWKRSFALVKLVYLEMRNCKDRGFVDQITRSAVSVPSNIAEGSERGSNKDFVKFLYIAKGSCGELATQLLLAGELGYIAKDKAIELELEALTICKMIGGLISAKRSA